MSRYRVDVNEEEFENITLFDTPMLFTSSRCDRKTLPQGMYMYEIRHDDDGQGYPCEVADWIIVNHWGTVISNRPIRFTETDSNGKPFRLIDSENDWNYESTDSTLKEYMEQYPPDLQRNEKDNERF